MFRTSQWVVLAAIVAACGAPTPARDALSGTYAIGGGDAALPQVQALVDAFVAKHPAVKFKIDTSLGSDGAVNLAADRTIDLGMVSRDLLPSESERVDHVVIGAAGTGLIVHATNAVNGLSGAQVQDIYAGRIKDWSVVGGPLLAIVPMVREKGSSARTALETYLFASKPVYGPGVIEIQGGEQMRQAVAAQRGGIGTIGVQSNDPEGAGIKLLTIDGVAATKQSLRDGTYKIRRPLYLVFARTSPAPAIAAFLDFVRGPDGQKVLDRF